MDIASVERNSALPAVAPGAPVEKASENREIVTAVKAVNKAEVLGRDNELTFQLDRQTRKMLIRVVDKKTGEVVSQLPPDYVLRLAENLK